MSPKDYDLLMEHIQEIQDETSLKDYHAFVYWFIDTVFGLEKKDILNSICDGMHDKGIDAVWIDPIEQHVIIIQSKFEHQGEQRQIRESEVKQFAAVRDYFKSRKALQAATAKANQAARRLLDKAFDDIHGKHFTWELIFITTHKEAPETEDLVYKTLSFNVNEFRIYDYNRMVQLLRDKMRDFTPLIAPYSLPYKDEDKTIVRVSPNRSWGLTVLTEQIRLMVNKYQDKLFRKNVRNFLGKSTCNKAIQETLKTDPGNFWYYNNGITILCDEASLNVEKRYIRLVNPQIVNGCQTARSIEKFQGDDSQAEVFVRVIESKSHAFINSITLYQNSSNPVKMRDFKSNDPTQVRLKHEFGRRGYYYEIKRGEEYKTLKQKYPAFKQEYPHAEDWGSISNETVAKVLAAVKLSPATATAKGSETFFDDKDNVYSSLFPEKISTYNCLCPYLLYDFFVRETYRGEKGKFHKLPKSWPFKNRASFYVLKFFYDAMKAIKDWEKGFVLFFENSTDDEYSKCYCRLEKIINRYFELIYTEWQSNPDKDDYNAYLQNSSTPKEIMKKNTKKLEVLAKKTQRIFADFLD